LGFLAKAGDSPLLRLPCSFAFLPARKTRAAPGSPVFGRFSFLIGTAPSSTGLSRQKGHHLTIAKLLRLN